jgi:hypothetical protein
MESWTTSPGSAVSSISSSSSSSFLPSGPLASEGDEAVSSTSSRTRGGRRAWARLERGGEAASCRCWVAAIGLGLAREKRGVGANCDPLGGGRYGCGRGGGGRC